MSVATQYKNCSKQYGRNRIITKQIKPYFRGFRTTDQTPLPVGPDFTKTV